MNDIFDLLLLIAAAVFISTITYHLFPFRKWVDAAGPPKFVVFPKYDFQCSDDFELLEIKLLTLGFEKK